MKQFLAPAGQILTRYCRKHANANVTIALSCLALIGIVWAWTLDRVTSERAEMLASAVKQNQNLALAFEEHTIRTFRSIDQSLSFVRSQYREHGLKLELRGMIDNGTLDAGLFHFIGVADETGNLVLASIEAEPVNMADLEHFEVQRQDNAKELFIGKPILGRVTQKWVIPVSRRIDKPDGSFGGIVYASMDPEYFTRFYHKADLGGRGAIALVGLDGIARARRAGTSSTFGDDFSNTTLFSELARNSSGNGFSGTGSFDGVPRWRSYRTIEGYPFIVVVSKTVADILLPFGPRQRRHYLSAAVGSAIVLLFGAVAWVALSRRNRALDAVAASEARFRGLLETAPDAVVIVDGAHHIQIVNAETERLFGYRRDELLGKSVELLVPERFRDRHPHHIGHYVKQPSARTMGAGAELWARRKDGSEFPTEISLSPLDTQHGLVTTSVIRDVTERRLAQEELKQSVQRAQALSERLMKVQQQERDSMAHELHDELGQTLTALKVNLQMLEPHCAGSAAESHLTEALLIAGRGLRQVRGMALDLRPPGLEHLGLAVALESHLAKQAQAAGWDTQYEVALPGRLRPELEMACFRVAQEALTNVMRHAHAKRVWVALGLTAGEVQLSVRDDGAGFDVARLPEPAPIQSFGLIGMQERVRQMGGRLALDSAPGRGTVVRASFPCEPAGRRASDANASARA